MILDSLETYNYWIASKCALNLAGSGPNKVVIAHGHRILPTIALDCLIVQNQHALTIDCDNILVDCVNLSMDHAKWWTTVVRPRLQVREHGPCPYLCTKGHMLAWAVLMLARTRLHTRLGACLGHFLCGPMCRLASSACL